MRYIKRHPVMTSIAGIMVGVLLVLGIAVPVWVTQFPPLPPHTQNPSLSPTPTPSPSPSSTQPSPSPSPLPTPTPTPTTTQQSPSPTPSPSPVDPTPTPTNPSSSPTPTPTPTPTQSPSPTPTPSPSPVEPTPTPTNPSSSPSPPPSPTPKPYPAFPLTRTLYTLYNDPLQVYLDTLYDTDQLEASKHYTSQANWLFEWTDDFHLRIKHDNTGLYLDHCDSDAYYAGKNHRACLKPYNDTDTRQHFYLNQLYDHYDYYSYDLTSHQSGKSLTIYSSMRDGGYSAMFDDRDHPWIVSAV